MLVKENNGISKLYHYTNEKGLNGILESGKLNPSTKTLNPKDVRYTNGQYLTDVVPGEKTLGQLSYTFLRTPWGGKRFTNYLEIDVSGLNIIKGRDGVYAIPNEGALDISNRIINYGKSTK
ncbi:HYD1 signature containing ADP-ribosyltransferase family protein [Bacillus spongiae]|uniref:HYD1 signature containing ADP-ribosyltransferase family protein n=1 Tax=Bacillus spongiae TaxID=2683610 RepID=A0ABU8HCT0_9BACI